jgi:hypothetical protein
VGRGKLDSISKYGEQVNFDGCTFYVGVYYDYMNCFSMHIVMA